jgi:hypothetical protein
MAFEIVSKIVLLKTPSTAATTATRQKCSTVSEKAKST